MRLRDGSTTDDPRLDRLVHFDERSRDYPIRALTAGRKARSYTWRCLDWYDQGREGACVAYALGHELAARPAEARGHSDAWLKTRYHDAQRIDPWPGGMYPGATPRYEGTSVLAGVKVFQSLGWFAEYRWAFGIDDLVDGLGYHGPAVLGVAWYDGMFRPDQDGFIRPTGAVRGGHAILARAIDVKRGVITLRNSWGRSWGVDGDCYITVEDLGRLLDQQGEAVFTLKRTSRP